MSKQNPQWAKRTGDSQKIKDGQPTSPPLGPSLQAILADEIRCRRNPPSNSSLRVKLPDDAQRMNDGPPNPPPSIRSPLPDTTIAVVAPLSNGKKAPTPKYSPWGIKDQLRSTNAPEDTTPEPSPNFKHLPWESLPRGYQKIDRGDPFYNIESDTPDFGLMDTAKAVAEFDNMMQESCDEVDRQGWPQERVPSSFGKGIIDLPCRGTPPSPFRRPTTPPPAPPAPPQRNGGAVLSIHTNQIV
jgi:hypothetical protein